MLPDTLNSANPRQKIPPIYKNESRKQSDALGSYKAIPLANKAFDLMQPLCGGDSSDLSPISIGDLQNNSK